MFCYIFWILIRLSKESFASKISITEVRSINYAETATHDRPGEIR